MQFSRNYRHALLASAVAIVSAAPALAQSRAFNVPAQAAAQGIPAFAEQADLQILIAQTDTEGRKTGNVRGAMTVAAGLRQLLVGSGLSVLSNDGRTITLGVRPPAAAVGNGGQDQTTSQAAPPADQGADIIVTAQKREERIQDVPIAISAFTKDTLNELKIETGAELLRAVPNVTFSKNNFSGYNFSIRGIGTKALSVTTDPSVAISFNNTPLIRNRLYEQEYFDVERVEVLRGPQGTLYGRNATGGVVNMITNKPTFDFEGEVKAEVGNFDTRRLSGFVNVPLSDTLAVRFAGAATQRDGFDYNTITKNNVNGRDLWSSRISAAWEPTDRFRANLIWEHFEEDDNRSRTGKQLCTRDPGPDSVGSADISDQPAIQGVLSIGCSPGSLFDESAYGTPNGLSVPLVIGSGLVQFAGSPPNTFDLVTLLQIGVDPYGGLRQSQNLREIASRFDPVFRAKNDVFQLNLEFDATDDLTVYSQTAYTKDSYYSRQDYNRFNTIPVFNDSSGFIDPFVGGAIGPGMAPGGFYTDPQLGTSNSVLGLDLNRAESEQWSQEFRLQSSFAGPINFSVGVNYQKFEIDEDYFVFFNLATAIAEGFFNGGNIDGSPFACPQNDSVQGCVYVDPNPIDEIDGNGHNYFRSRNLYSFTSKAAFGEVYWNIAPDVKITGGLRYTDDDKTATPVPSQLLLTSGTAGGGFVSSGYPEQPDIEQGWQEVTGRIGIDWKPQLSFTDQTLLYAFYSRGYKGGGANPPGIGSNPQFLSFLTQRDRFDAEYVNAFEIGAKNTLMGGTLTLNASAFYYDYQDYQLSKIVDRTALNENVDATVWGLELEGVWRPSRAFSLNFNVGYLDTKIAKGEQSIDVMDRTQGNADWTVVKPWLQLASNCVARTEDVETVLNAGLGDFAAFALTALCGGSFIGDYKPGANPNPNAFDFAGLLGFFYDPLVDGPNQGQGFFDDLSGNELPNSPHLTVNIGAQYTVPFGDWAATLRGDYYRQSESFARVYNTEFDRLRGWDNANLSLTVAKPDDDLVFQFYVKNLFDDTPITDAFINSDDSGLTTNVFTLDPRIFGFSITKGF